MSDRDARAFLKGKPDPWGMKVNSNYKYVAMPFASFPLLDESLSTTFAPIQGMDALARQLSIAQFPGAFMSQENGQNVTVKPPRQNPGAREVIGIIDAADASRFLMSTASLQNASGAYVTPTTASFQRRIAHAKVNPDGVTRTVDLASKAKRIYPLTLQISAALSTTADHATRDQGGGLPRLRRRTRSGPGREAGQLPAGPRPADEGPGAQVAAARAPVLAGPQATPTADPSDTPTDSPTTGTPGTTGTAPGLGLPGISHQSGRPGIGAARGRPVGSAR